jgi:type IV secretory pathway VirB2 component (pilin)
VNTPGTKAVIGHLALAGAIALIAANPALAQTTGAAGSNLGTFIQNVVDLLNNNIIRGVATIAVILTGIGWMTGHVDLRRAGTVVIGIVVVFGAATIVGLITGTSSS